MNPIIAAIGECHAIGLRVTRIRPESMRHPKAVMLELDGADELRIPIESPNHEAFLRIWREAAALEDIQWDSID